MFSAWRSLDLKAQRAEVNQGLDLDLRLENLVITSAFLSNRVDRVVLYAIRKEPDDFGGLVMSLEHSRPERMELISMEWRRRNEWNVGGGSGVRSREFGENREVIRWRAVGNRQRWSKRRVSRCYYRVENVILVAIWKMYELSWTTTQKRETEVYYDQNDYPDECWSRQWWWIHEML